MKKERGRRGRCVDGDVGGAWTGGVRPEMRRADPTHCTTCQGHLTQDMKTLPRLGTSTQRRPLQGKWWCGVGSWGVTPQPLRWRISPPPPGGTAVQDTGTPRTLPTSHTGCALDSHQSHPPHPPPPRGLASLTASSFVCTGADSGRVRPITQTHLRVIPSDVLEGGEGAGGGV